MKNFLSIQINTKKFRIGLSLIMFLIVHTNTYLTLSSLFLYIFLQEIKAEKLIIPSRNLIFVNSYLGFLNRNQSVRNLFYETKKLENFSFLNKLIIDMFLHFIPSLYLIFKKNKKIKNIDKFRNILATDIYTLTYLVSCYLKCPKLKHLRNLYNINKKEFIYLFIIHNLSTKILNIF